MTTRKKTARKPGRKKAPKGFDARVKDSAQKIWLAGLGAFALAEEEGGKLFRNLVSKGESFEDKGRGQFEKVRDRVESFAEVARDKASEVAGEVRDRAGSAWGRVGDNVDDAVASALHKVGVPTREEIQRLTRRIEHLTTLVEEKAGSKRATGRKTATRKAATRKAPRRKSVRKSTARAAR